MLDFVSRLWTILALFAICQTSFAADGVSDALNRLSQITEKKERIEAINALSDLRKNADSVKAIPILTKIAEDKDAEIREAALVSLALISSALQQSCPDVLIRALFDRNDNVRGTAFSYIACPGFKDYSKASLALLLHALEHPDADVRSNVSAPLVRAGGKSKEVLAALEKATKDKVQTVRNNAHVALWHLTNNWDPYVRNLLVNIETPAALGSGPVTGSHDAKRESEAMSLLAISSTMLLQTRGKEKPAHLVPILIKLLKDESPLVRRGAARTLGTVTIDNPKGEEILKELHIVEALRRAIKDDDEQVRRRAKIALYRITKDWDRCARLVLDSAEKWNRFPVEPKDATPAEKEKHERESNVLFFDGPSQLTEIIKENPAELAPVLIKLLGDASPTVRKCAAQGLGYMAEEKNSKATAVLKQFMAETAVKKLLDDPDFDVRSEAEWTLKKFAK